MSKITYVNLGDLNLPAFQAHKQIPKDYLNEISESIKSIGIIEPLIVRDTDDGLEIVAGCVRYHASRLAGLKAVPCINMTLDPKAAEIIKLHENIKRIPLDHVDQGETFIMMNETFSMTEQAIADSVGKSIAYVSQHMSLVKLANEITQAVKAKRISFSQARELMRVSDKSERLRLLNYCQNDGATIQVLQRWVQEYLRNSSPPSSPMVDKSDQINDLPVTKILYKCQACDKSVDINDIRQVFYCKICSQSIKQAINDEKSRISENSPKKTS